MTSRKTEEELSYMKYAGKVTYELLELMETEVKVGVTTNQLDEIAEKFIRSHNCTPSFLNYEGFPKSICTSINEEVVHGIPSNRKLKNGDIISIDVGACYKGYHADTARTYKVGHIKKEELLLMKNTERALMKGLSVIKDGVKLNEVCKAIESVAKENGYGVIKELTGHGIGDKLHDDPYVPNYANKHSEMILKEGMTIAVEPMFALKRREVWMPYDDDWTISTQDGSVAAHYEHTVVVTKDGYEILTK